MEYEIVERIIGYIANGQKNFPPRIFSSRCNSSLLSIRSDFIREERNYPEAIAT